MPRGPDYMEDPDAVRSREYGTETGQALVELAAERGGQEIKYQDDHVNAITDAITNLLHHAAAMRMDTDMILRVAIEHFDYEQAAWYEGDLRDR